eukprot:TRINITY_DN1569_c0_g1_i1.p1 TRINITY_DN1569_c0_g1~~TRINITY_DN1569_c0_g1_i1.p1  ORF type:complete len:786 (+),score=230.87 TRINITY_DN1569_c0_g1_i1:37-2394(+)
MAAKAPEPEEDQEKLIEDAKKVVKEQAFHMKRCLDQAKLMEALKHSSTMISELRTGLLTPRNYYELYMLVTDQLRDLEAFIYEEHTRGRKMMELYEVVQYAGNILPRLYLLITVGSVYIRSKEAPAREILKDLVEMCRGVQHPMRGLFLRNYLSQMAKDKLPDEDSDDGNVHDSIDFILQNFTEMNKLWVRLQHQGPVRDREKRERERQDLRILVGTNLVRISQLESVTVSIYSKEVLPKLLDQVINCKDQIAQQYLMESIIQVFPDEFHLSTLESLLEGTTQLQNGVDVKDIYVSLIDRLANFAKRAPGQIPDDIAIFEIFSKSVAGIITARPKMALSDVLSLNLSLLNLSLKVYPERHDYVDNVFSNVVGTFTKLEIQKLDQPACVKLVVELLTVPVDLYESIVQVLNLENHPKLLKFLDYATRKTVSVRVVSSILKHVNDSLSDPADVNKLLDLISPLISDQEDQPSAEAEDKDDFEEEQNLVSRLIHFFRNDDTDVLFQTLLVARKHFGHGGPQRIRHTLVPLIFRGLHLAQRIRARELKGAPGAVPSKKILQFVFETCTALSQHQPHANTVLRLFLQCAQAADNCGFDAIAYEFFTQAFVIYESEISDSKMQFQAINLIIASLQNSANFSAENYDTLITKAVQYAAKLLKKPDQCRAVYLCSHLFWTGKEGSGYREGKKVLECLQRSLKIANACVDTVAQLQLFVEILNEYLSYFENKTEDVTANYLSVLISLINTRIANVEQSNDDTGFILTYYRNTLSHIKARKESADGGRYEELDTS